MSLTEEAVAKYIGLKIAINDIINKLGRLAMNLGDYIESHPDKDLDSAVGGYHAIVKILRELCEAVEPFFKEDHNFPEVLAHIQHVHDEMRKPYSGKSHAQENPESCA